MNARGVSRLAPKAQESGEERLYVTSSHTNGMRTAANVDRVPIWNREYLIRMSVDFVLDYA